MRLAGWIMALVLTGVWFLSEIPSSGLTNDPQPPKWRRSAQGWVHFTRVLPPSASQDPGLHPGLVAMMEILVSCAALLAFSRNPIAGGASKERIPGPHYGRSLGQAPLWEDSPPGKLVREDAA